MKAENALQVSLSGQQTLQFKDYIGSLAHAVHRPRQTLPVNHMLRAAVWTGHFVIKLSYNFHMSVARLDFKGLQAHILLII